MSIADNEFPNALFASPETAVAGFSLLRTALRSDPTLYKPSDVYLLGVLRATRPDRRAGYCYRAQYANLPEYVYGPGGTGSDREALERDGWTFEPATIQSAAT